MLLRGKVCSCVWCSILCFLMLPVLAVLRGSILWILLVLRVLHSSVWCPKYCEYWEYEQYEN